VTAVTHRISTQGRMHSPIKINQRGAEIEASICKVCCVFCTSFTYNA